MTHFERRFPHGTPERFLGTETVDGCDCKPCRRAYRARQEARTSFTYYKRSDPITAYGRGSKGDERRRRQREDMRRRRAAA